MRTTRMSQQQKPQKLSSIKNTLKFQFDDDQQNSKSPSQVTIKDLCPEDKAKIGDLIKKLAQEQEEKKQLAQKIQAKEDQFKKSVKKYKMQSDSAKKQQQETEAKFRESLIIIKQLQQQESLIQEQIFQNHVTKFDSFTQCEFENTQQSNDNKENSQCQSKVLMQIQSQLPSALSEKPPKPKSEILQLKAEIEEITNSLKQMQFTSSDITQETKQRNIDISPLRQNQKNIRQSYQPIQNQELTKYNQEKQSKLDKISNSTYQQEQQLKQTQQQQQQQQQQQKQQQQQQQQLQQQQQQQQYQQQQQQQQQVQQVQQVQQIKQQQKQIEKSEIAIQTGQFSESKCVQTDEKNINNAPDKEHISKRCQQKRFYDEFIKLENRLSQNKSKYVQSEQNMSFQKSEHSHYEEDEDDLNNIDNYKDDDDLDEEDEYFIAQQLQRIQQERLRNNIQNTPKIKQVEKKLQNVQQTNLSRKFQFPTQQSQVKNVSQQIHQSTNFRTNTLSFNLTNEQTPQHSQALTYQNSSLNTKNEKSDTQQFGASVLQTPQQQSLFKQEDPEDIDSIISSLNGRTFKKDISQQLHFQFEDQAKQSYVYQDQTRQSQNKLKEVNEDENNSSNSSIPMEEYQKLISKYMKSSQEGSENASLMCDKLYQDIYE